MGREHLLLLQQETEESDRANAAQDRRYERQYSGKKVLLGKQVILFGSIETLSRQPLQRTTAKLDQYRTPAASYGNMQCNGRLRNELSINTKYVIPVEEASCDDTKAVLM